MIRDTRRSSTSFAWPSELDIERQVAERGRAFRRVARTGAWPRSKVVREVRVFGLLIAIELDIKPLAAALAAQAPFVVLPARDAPTRGLSRAWRAFASMNPT